jgi:predicted DNA-binding transcriptional regulator AlpA
MSDHRALLTEPEDLPELLLPTIVCERLKVSRSWLYASAEDARIPSVHLGGPDGPLRFVATDVAGWLDEARSCVLPGKVRCGLRPPGREPAAR